MGTLVGPVQPAAAAAPRSPAAAAAPRSPGAARQTAARPHPVASGPSVLAAAGFSGVAVVAAGLGFAYSRRQRPVARRPR